MKQAAKVGGILFITLLMVTLYFAGSEAISKHEAESVCSKIKLGMSSLEISRLAEEKGAITWKNEEYKTVTVAVGFPISGAYLCRMQMNSGSVVNIGKMERMPGG